MAVLTVALTNVTGTTLAMAAAAGGGDEFVAVGGVCLLVRNADASSKTVTVVRPGTTYGTADPDIAVTVAAGATAVIGPIPSEFANPADGNIDITYSAVTSVTVAPFRVY